MQKLATIEIRMILQNQKTKNQVLIVNLESLQQIPNPDSMGLEYILNQIIQYSITNLNIKNRKTPALCPIPQDYNILPHSASMSLTPSQGGSPILGSFHFGLVDFFRVPKQLLLGSPFLDYYFLEGDKEKYEPALILHILALGTTQNQYPF